MLAFPSAPMSTLGRQLTKYINQCREKDLIPNAKKKLLAFAQPRGLVHQTPPPLPQVDYSNACDLAATAGDVDSERSWGSDFDDDSDFESTDVAFNEPENSQCSHQVASTVIKSENDAVTGKECTSKSPLRAQLPLTMMNPTKEETECKPPLLTKPTIKPKPMTKMTTLPSPFKPISSPSGVPRPPSELPIKPRICMARPNQQPPPPPPSVAAKARSSEELRERVDDLAQEEYEVPVSRLDSDVSSVASSTSNFTPSSTGFVSNGDESASSGSSSSCSDQPALPPRISLNSILSPPPLPRKPASKLSETPRCSSEKPVLLPTRRSDENGKNRDGQFKVFGNVLKTKLSSLLHTSDRNKNDSSSSHSGSRSSTPDPSVPTQDQCHHIPVISRTRSQEPLGNRYEIRSNGYKQKHRSSLEDGVMSLQNRPLPPVPPSEERRPSAPADCTTFSQTRFYSCDWFHDVERNVAETLLLDAQQTGCYLVRQSRRAGEENPYTLNILFEGKVFHLNIRLRPDSTFALGKEKPNEKTFATVADLVKYHQTEAILLTTKGQPVGKTCLLTTPPKT